jgi:uncharacterized 2Fe-2S/4Fe-4S cluster protein (DUF4445 family)
VNPDVVNEALVVFTPSGKRGRFPVGTRLLEAARKLGVDIDSVCGGRALCGRCQVNVGEGSFAKHGIDSTAAHLNGFTATEERYRTRKGLQDGRRLSCQSLLEGDVVIDVPPESQVHKQVVRKRAEVREIAIDPITTLHFVEVQEPDMHDPRGDFERLQEALRTQWQMEGLTADLHVLQGLQKALRKGAWKVTVAVHDNRRIVAVWPGFTDKIFGLAVDIGSTTIAAHLCDLASGEVVASSGLMNPQIRFGEDLMSRVSYVMMNPGGEVEMTAAVREALASLAREVAKEAGIDTDLILEAVFVGNPVMHHLLLGIDPTELGGAPFALALDSALDLRATDLGLQDAMNRGGGIYVLPCIAGHVGADAAGVVLSETPYLRDEVSLVVDVGTNAEIVLGNKDRLLACSSPTGPAFEGAEISSGQRAAPGAIERIRIDPETLEPRYRIIGLDKWSDEDGFEEESWTTGVTGICGSAIIEVVAEMYLSGIISEDGVVDGSLAARSPRIVQNGRTWSYLLREGREGEPRITVTQNDIRAIQLAKAALYAGVKLLMEKQGVETVDTIRFAGAFGSFIDPKYAMVLGLIPDCELSEVKAVGNAAGTGALMALLNRSHRREIEKQVAQIEKIETALEPHFQQLFIDAMALPNKVDPFPKLSAAIKLPPRKTVSEDGVAGDATPRRRGREGHAARRARE